MEPHSLGRDSWEWGPHHRSLSRPCCPRWGKRKRKHRSMCTLGDTAYCCGSQVGKPGSKTQALMTCSKRASEEAVGLISQHPPPHPALHGHSWCDSSSAQVTEGATRAGELYVILAVLPSGLKPSCTPAKFVTSGPPDHHLLDLTPNRSLL